MKTCKHGHEYDPELSYDGKRGRNCPVCMAKWKNDWQNRKYAEDPEWRENRKQRSRDKYDSDFVYRSEKQLAMRRSAYERNSLRLKERLELLRKESP